jgi:hypothetical protein
MRFANRNPNPAAANPNLNAQQQKIFDMNNNHHNVGHNMVGGVISPTGNTGPQMAISMKQGAAQNNFANRKKISTQQQNRSHSVNTH